MIRFARILHPISPIKSTLPRHLQLLIRSTNQDLPIRFPFLGADVNYRSIRIVDALVFLFADTIESQTLDSLSDNSSQLFTSFPNPSREDQSVHVTVQFKIIRADVVENSIGE